MIAFTCLGAEEQQCITVSGEDGMFVTNNYIPTHNSSMQQAVYLPLPGTITEAVWIKSSLEGVRKRQKFL